MPVTVEPSAAATCAPAGVSATPVRLYGLPPLVSQHTVVLILGSFPGAASLRARQYYAHPQNHFWKILQALWPESPLPAAAEPGGYEARCAWLLERRLGLWDVYESCEREGSLDTRIRNARVNDFAGLMARCPGIRAVAHNGAESHKHSKAVLASLERAEGPQSGVLAHRLPSTSPANASWSFERKLDAWAALMVAHELT